jgi:hypothetical protein
LGYSPRRHYSPLSIVAWSLAGYGACLLTWRALHAGYAVLFLMTYCMLIWMPLAILQRQGTRLHPALDMLAARSTLWLAMGATVIMRMWEVELYPRDFGNSSMPTWAQVLIVLIGLAMVGFMRMRRGRR